MFCFRSYFLFWFLQKKKNSGVVDSAKCISNKKNQFLKHFKKLILIELSLKNLLFKIKFYIIFPLNDL